jgi:O-antigen ligase
VLGALRRPAVGRSTALRTAVLAVLGCALASLAGPLVARSPAAAVMMAALLIVALTLAVVRHRPVGEVLVILVILIGGLVDIPQRIHVGPTTGQGVETVALIGVMLLVILSGYLGDGVPLVSRAWPILLFVIWSIMSFAWDKPTQEGMQNVLVYCGFLGALVIAATVGRWQPDGGFAALDLAFKLGAGLGLSLYAIGLPLGGHIGGHGTNVVVSARPFGLFAMLVVAWFSAARLAGDRWAVAIVAAAVLLTVLSLSRSALGAQLAVIVLSRFDPRNFRSVVRTVAVVVSVAAAGVAAVLLFPPLHHRFFHGDTASVGGFSLNVTGRDALWTANWGWFTQKPWVGWGAGSADRMTAALPGHNAGHPHNDYLRLLVDFGLVGFALWMIGFLILLRLSWRAWQSVRGTGTRTEQLHAAAVLGMVGIAIVMMVDNPLIEIVKMAPLGALIGVSLGVAARGGLSGPPAFRAAVERPPREMVAA